MSYPLLLNTLYQPRRAAYSKAPSQDRIFRSFFEGHCVNDRLIDKLLQFDDVQKGLTPWSSIIHWQELLSLLLILHERNELEPYSSQLIERVRCLNACFVWHELQPAAIYRAICAHLLGQPVKEPMICQHASGAAPLEWGKHWSWGSIPHSRFHAEIGFLWCLYGQLREDVCYFKAAESLAEWQLNALDHHFLPFCGLFSHEEDASESRLLIHHFLLFSAVAAFAARSDMAALAEKQYERIAALASMGKAEFSSLHLACDKWLSKHSFNLEKAIGRGCQIQGFLPSVFQDEQLALAGCRSTSESAVSTLSGGGTSMGCLYREDVHIVCFGPQHLPLGDCRGFGIESQENHLPQTKIEISAANQTYSIQGLVRMSPRPKTSLCPATFRNGEHSGCWIDVKQNYQNKQLTIETIFRGLFDISMLAFVFFVKARSCAVEKSKMVNLRSFDRYQGEIRDIVLHGEQTALMIEAGRKQGEMQVIPLGGGNNFWGADFLVAYLLISDEYSYSWTIK